MVLYTTESKKEKDIKINKSFSLGLSYNRVGRIFKSFNEIGMSRSTLNLLRTIDKEVDVNRANTFCLILFSYVDHKSLENRQILSEHVFSRFSLIKSVRKKQKHISLQILVPPDDY